MYVQSSNLQNSFYVAKVLTTTSVKWMRDTKFYNVLMTLILSSVLVILTVSLPLVVGSITNNIIIENSGKIITLSPLYTEGRWIKDINNKTVILRGVWLAEYADSCVGAWGGDYFTWNEDNVRADMQNLRDVWHVNAIMTFIWGSWWMEDKAVTLGGYTTSHHYRFAIKEAIKIAQEYGLYFQIRLWAIDPSEGRVGQPYSPYSSLWTQQDFIDFWVSVAAELKNYPNVIFTLYDEPHGDQDLWFQMANKTIYAIRQAGANQLILVHWGFCGSCMWMEKWVQQGYPTENIVFSNHIYRFHGTFEYNPNSPTDIDYIRDFLARKPSEDEYDGAAYKYITDTYNIPIWVSAIGAYRGFADDSEYNYFKNTLTVLNEWNFSYCAYQWFRSDLPWYIGWHEPNRVGQALIEAITSP